MFDLLGVAVGLYALVAVATGSVWAKSGPGARRISRDQSPHYFWVVIIIYAGLALAMILLF